MAKIVYDEYQKAEYLWRKTEARLAENIRAGMDPAYAERERQALWEKMHMQFGDLERFGRQLLPEVPDPGLLLKQAMAQEAAAKAQQLAQQEAARKARVEHMQSAAMACSITDGLNLWVARWGEGWVLVVDVQKASVATDAFRWDLLQTRLTRTNKIEVDGEYVRIVT